jgi:phosphomevalonate kinase
LKVTIQAPGKLILLGEYAVLEGAPALVAAVDRFAHVTSENIEGNTFFIESPEISKTSLSFLVKSDGTLKFEENAPKDALQKLNFISNIFKHGYKILKTENTILPSVKIVMDTSEFFLKERGVKLGLGSSAALSVALLGGLLKQGNQSIETREDQKRFFKIAMEAHSIAQGGIGSGVDVAASVFGGILRYQSFRDSSEHPFLIDKLENPADLHMLPVWSGRSASTPEMVNRVNLFRNKDEKSYLQIMDTMVRLARDGCEMILKKEVSDFMEIVKEYYQALKKLGEKSDTPIISTEHREIASIAAQTKEVVYKPSGSGGGDFGIAFSKSKAVLDFLKDQLQQKGYAAVDLNVVNNGFQLSINERDENGKITNS